MISPLATPPRRPVRQQRLIRVRVLRYLTAEVGIRQFLDIGTAVTSASNPTRSPRMELDCSGWPVGDREAADPAVEGAAAG